MYHVIYDTSQGEKNYTIHPLHEGQAEEHLAMFSERYLNLDGTAKLYPNGRGRYDIANPRIVPA